MSSIYDHAGSAAAYSVVHGTFHNVSDKWASPV